VKEAAPPKPRGVAVGEGWFAYLDARTRQPYFYHPATKTTQWEPPAHVVAARGAAPAAQRAPPV
jgi:hypothetical protein